MFELAEAFIYIRSTMNEFFFSDSVLITQIFFIYLFFIGNNFSCSLIVERSMVGCEALYNDFIQGNSVSR